jgi:PD-(D/E)XK endonuclease
MKRFEQGDFGELSAMQWLAQRGARIAVPVGHNDCWDLVAELDRELIRVQVKTCGFWRNERWEVTLCTRGGNRSWSGVSKTLDPTAFEYLFVHVADGRRWMIPASEIAAGSSLLLGGPKYARYEIEAGGPFPSRADAADVAF